MSAFKALRDLSISFENYSRQVSAELFSVKSSEPFEDVVAGKVQDFRLLTSKFKLLEAEYNKKELQINETRRSENTIPDYEDTVVAKIIEQQVVKAITQSHAVKRLLTFPNQDLRPEFVERKERILEELKKYRENETELRSLEELLEEKETHLLEVRRRWDEAVGKLKDIPTVVEEDGQKDDAFDKKLKTLTEKTEVMRLLVTKLVTSRYDMDYDWLADPDQRIRALAAARRRSDAYE